MTKGFLFKLHFILKMSLHNVKVISSCSNIFLVTWGQLKQVVNVGILYITSEVDKANLLANSCLFTEDTENN